MYKLMLVDDHKVILEGIELMIRGFNVAFDRFVHASNGKEALALIEKERPDAIITDIRMPVMDGLSLCRSIRGRNDEFAEMPIILLTGYDEFEYARQGIEFKAAFYLLKPVEKEELFAALKTVELVLDKQKQPHFSQYNVNSDIIVRAVNGQKHLEPLDGNLVLYHFLPPEGKDFQSEEVVAIKAAFADHVRSFYVRKTDIYVLAEFAGSFQIPEWLKQNMQINASAVLNSSEELFNAVHQLYIMQMKRNAMQSNGLLTYNDMVLRTASLCQPKQEIIQSVVQAVTNQDQEQLKQVLLAVNADFDKLSVGAEQAVAWYSGLCMGIYKYFYDSISQPELIEAFNFLLYSEILLAKENGKEEMARFVEEHLSTILLLFRQFSDRSLVERAKLLMSAHLGMTQQELADELHISSQYLSKLFHEEIGETFSEYRIRQRISLSMEYLKTTNMTVEEIGKKVGYISEKHFYHVFKRIARISPAQYRRHFRVQDSQIK